MTGITEHARQAEALLFAAAEPLDEESIKSRLPDNAVLEDVLAELVAHYDGRGINLVQIGGRWSFRTAPDLGHVLERHITLPRRLSRAGIETLAIIAYHQPVTRADIEDIRGVAVSKGTLDTLLEVGWIRPKGRRRTPGRPITYATTDEFLQHFGVDSLDALPGLEELKATGMLRGEPPMAMIQEAAQRAQTETDTGLDLGADVTEVSEQDPNAVVPLKRL